MGKRKNRMLNQSPPNTQKLLSEQLYEYDYNFYNPHSNLTMDLLESHQDCVQLRNSVFDSIQKLYSEYYQDFIKCQETKLINNSAINQRQTYNLHIERKYKRQLRRQIFELIRNNQVNEAYFQYKTCVTEFTQNLFKALATMQSLSKLLQIVCLNEAYCTLYNAADEMGQITHYLFGSKHICIIFNKLIFNKKVLINFQDLVDYAKANYHKNSAFRELIQIQKELELLSAEQSTNQICARVLEQYDDQFSDIVDGNLTQISDEDYNSDNSVQCSTQDMSIDEVVSFINGTPEKGRQKARTPKHRRSKPSLASKNTSASPQSRLIEENVDEEVANFRWQLEQFPPRMDRVKPRVTLEFIHQIRVELINKTSGSLN